MCKPLHAGTASEHGLRAARLAAKGFTARGDSLECDQGFASSQSDHLEIDAALGEPPQGWHLRNNLFKYHAACYLTHAPIECAKEIRLKSNFPPERVKKIVLQDRRRRRQGLQHPEPDDRAGGQVLAAPDRGHGADRRRYGERSIPTTTAITQEPRIKALRDKMAIDFKPNWAHSVAEMAIQLDDGTTLEATHDSGIPWADVAKQRQRARRPSSTAWSTPVLGAAGAKRLHDAIERIDSLCRCGRTCARAPRRSSAASRRQADVGRFQEHGPELVPKGNRYEDFEPGRVFKHHWGRTITESESTLFSTLTLHFNPHYFNAAYARAHGHPGIVANPLLVFTTVFGLTVEDLSEGGGPFLGVNQLTYHQPVYPGDSLRAESVVLDRRVVGQPQGLRHRHLAHQGLQPARRARHRLQAHQPRSPKEAA